MGGLVSLFCWSQQLHHVSAGSLFVCWGLIDVFVGAVRVCRRIMISLPVS